MNSSKGSEKPLIDALIKQRYPHVDEWLRTAPSHPWEYTYGFMSEPWGFTAYVVISVSFDNMADAALFRLFFAGTGTP